MTPAEKRSLFIGVAVGMLIAAAGATAILFQIEKARPLLVQSTTAPNTSEVPAPGDLPGAESPLATQLSPEEQTKIGLQTTEVRRESLTEDLTAIGRVEAPETAIATIGTRFGGRVEQLLVKYVGQPVQSGDPVAIIQITGQPAGKDDPVSSIYSRDILAAAQEYKFALDSREHAYSMSRPEAMAQADALVEASRIRLERFGIKADQVDSVLSPSDKSEEKPIRVTVNASASGIVRDRKVAEGQFVNSGDTLIELTDLKSVWVKANIFDADLPRIQPGIAGMVNVRRTWASLTSLPAESVRTT
ncbi:MAG TPA: efflux RND transporter periplasmic adaptor subunit [Terriglobia bacterium]|nr:efflux RND transporter periplasmic adaptor subunit [Terriglobia bacterium]